MQLWIEGGQIAVRSRFTTKKSKDILEISAEDLFTRIVPVAYLWE